MAESVLDDIVRIRRQVEDAGREHGHGKDVGGELAAAAEGLDRLLGRVEALLDEASGSGLDERTRFVSDLAGRLLCAAMAARGGAAAEAQLGHAVEMASEIVRRVQARG